MNFVSYSYSVPYLLFLFALILLMFWEFTKINKGKGIKEIRFFVILLFVFFWGCVSFVGRDVFFYYDLFKSMPTVWHWDAKKIMVEKIEAGFKYYMVAIKSIYPDYNFFLIINTLIDAIILDKFFRRYSKYYVLAFIIYTLFYGHIFELEQIRNGKSLMLFLLSIQYIEKRKITPFILINLLGVTFHFTSIFYLFTYFLVRKNYSIYFYFVWFLILNAIFIFKIPILEFGLNTFGFTLGDTIETKLKAYIKDPTYSQNYGISLGYIERNISYVLICLIFKNKLLAQNKNNIIFINTFMLFFSAFFLLSNVYVVVVRVSALFYFSYAITYSNMFYEFKEKIYKEAFILLFIAYASIRFVSYHKTVEYKYENILLHKTDIEKRRETAKKSFEYWKKNENQR